METKKKTIRCAIYTRKSSEEGLEQDFNSLDAQREACESYIKSQQHEGWVLFEKQYNDGGFSGGTLERPALKELFQDIEDGKVDTVVVYKIDRLTRSLMDFSKIVELFDKKSTTFVSITQQFNTTTSMGRLTLNILLSFAQFEREVTGERIRDKKAASAKRGMWMSGKPPIGYKLENKKLVPDEAKISTVSAIFEKYLEFEGMLQLKQYLDENKMKSRTDRNISKGNLYKILSNKIYIGLISYKGNDYEGEHEGIIDPDIFNKVQELLKQNRNNNKCKHIAKSPSLLAGKLYDDNGNRMSPSHSNKNGRRYRYYVSQALLQFRKQDAGTSTKIPAGEIENFVIDEISRFVFDREKIQKYIADFDVDKQKDILDAMKNLNKNIQNNLSPNFIRTILSKIILSKDKVEITICQNQLIKTLEAITYGTSLHEEIKGETSEPIIISREIKISNVAFNGRSIVISNAENKELKFNRKLINAITKSFYWNNLLISGEVKSSTDIQKLEGLTDNSYIKDVLLLRFLAPDIIEKIINGTQPTDWSIKKLFDIKTLDWQEQRKILSA